MGKTLDALRHLQEVERKLGDLRREEEAKRRQVRAYQRQIDKGEQELQQRQNATRRQEAEIHGLELDISARDQSIQKHRIALNQAKTNREYAALLSALNTEKADLSKLESRVLEMMGAKDQLQSAHQELAAERDRLREKHAEAEARLAAYLERTRDQSAQLRQEREEVCASLPPTWVSTFDRAAERLDGEALASVIKVNPKRDEYVCGGCNMALTLETVNAVRTRDEVIACNICGRILWFED